HRARTGRTAAAAGCRTDRRTGDQSPEAERPSSRRRAADRRRAGSHPAGQDRAAGARPPGCTHPAALLRAAVRLLTVRCPTAAERTLPGPARHQAAVAPRSIPTLAAGPGTARWAYPPGTAR